MPIWTAEGDKIGFGSHFERPEVRKSGSPAWSGIDLPRALIPRLQKGWGHFILLNLTEEMATAFLQLISKRPYMSKTNDQAGLPDFRTSGLPDFRTSN
jgi:hypothetical protein